MSINKNFPLLTIAKFAPSMLERAFFPFTTVNYEKLC